MSFTIGSLFDGSGGFPLAAFMCGGVPVWASEIEPYPIAVTKTRFPYMKHLGSVTDIKGSEIEPVDVITFGSPCQDLSVAGKRAGLKHTDNGDEETTRSGLFMEAVRIIKEMREATGGKCPRFALWENVPGAFSSNKGEDFRVVCEELIKIVEPTAVMPPVPQKGWSYADHYSGDGWSLAYRVLDAQYWGVPQRRRRIYFVLDLGGQCAREVSFEREGLRGYFEKGRTPWEAATGDAEDCTRTADCERSHVVYSFDSVASNSMKSRNPHSGCRQVEIAKTLDTTDPNPSKNQGGIAILEPIVKGIGLDIYNLAVTGEVAASLTTATGQGASNTGPSVITFEPGIAAREGGHIYDGVSGTLRANAGDNRMAVAYSFDALSSNSMKSSNPHSGCRQVEIAKCLDTTNPNPSKNQSGIAIVERVPYTLKIRSGCEGGGKGALIQTNQSATLATNNDQYPFQPVIDTTILDDQGGSQISVRTDGKCPTLRAEMHGNVPCVLKPVIAIDQQGGKGGANYAVNVMPTICSDSHGTPHAVCYDIGEARLRTPSEYTELAPTITARCGTGGNNVPAVVYDARGNGEGRICPTLTGDHENRVTDYTALVCLEGNGSRESHHGDGYVESNVMYTLNTVERHAVCIPVHDQATRFSGKHGDKQDGKGNGLGVDNPGDPMNTLTGGDRHAVAYCIGNGQVNDAVQMEKERCKTLNCMVDPMKVLVEEKQCVVDAQTELTPQTAGVHGVDCRNFTESPELYPTLQAKSNGGQSLNYSGAVRTQHIVADSLPPSALDFKVSLIAGVIPTLKLSSPMTNMNSG